jgi:hypothetical protein
VWANLLGEGDENDDGEITFEEFKTMMEKLLSNKKQALPLPHSHYGQTNPGGAGSLQVGNQAEARAFSNRAGYSSKQDLHR